MPPVTVRSAKVGGGTGRTDVGPCTSGVLEAQPAIAPATASKDGATRRRKAEVEAVTEDPWNDVGRAGQWSKPVTSAVTTGASLLRLVDHLPIWKVPSNA